MVHTVEYSEGTSMLVSLLKKCWVCLLHPNILAIFSTYIHFYVSVGFGTVPICTTMSFPDASFHPLFKYIPRYKIQCLPLTLDSLPLCLKGTYNVLGKI